MATFDLHAELAAITMALDQRGIEYAVCGALALAVHGHPRATKDIDLLVAPAAIDDAKRILAALGYTFAAAPMTFQSGITVHRVSRIEGAELLTVDLILGGGAVQTALAGRLRARWGERETSVVSREGLIALKRLANRPQDRADLAALGEDEGE